MGKTKTTEKLPIKKQKQNKNKVKTTLPKTKFAKRISQKDKTNR
jgi:hypothetical protein